VFNFSKTKKMMKKTMKNVLTMKTVKKTCCHAALLAGLAFFAAACGDKDEEKDVKGPEITLAEPEIDEEFAAGSKSGVHMKFDLADPSGLNWVKIDIHSNSGEGHSHSSLLKAATTDWSYQETYDGAKGLKNHHAHIHSDSIPADATLGEYHLGISATDVHGNETTVYRTFVIVDHLDDDHDDHDDHDD
jgi:hypothetical protein